MLILNMVYIVENQKREQTMPNRQITGMRGVYLVAAELSKREFIVSPTSRSAQGADLLVTDQMCKRAYTVQVKTDTTGNNFFLVGKKVEATVSRSHIYVLVRIRNPQPDREVIDFYVVRSAKLFELAYHGGKTPNIKINAIERYKNNWKTFGKS